MGKDTAAKPEELSLIDSQDPNDGREKPTLTKCPLTYAHTLWYVHVPTKSHVDKLHFSKTVLGEITVIPTTTWKVLVSIFWPLVT